MAKKKKRINLDETPGALNDAFGGLALKGLPEGPEQTEAADKPKAKQPSLCLRRETAHRGGKAVVVVYDFPRQHPKASIETLAKDLKQRCGCGGTVKNREIVIQGEKVAEVRQYLESQGHRMRGETG